MFCAMVSVAAAQNSLTREQILNMSTEELSELPLEDLMEAVETLGVSSVDELFALIMNKNVSSASKAEETSFTSPLSTTVITKAEMRTYGITSIEEAFRLIPGVIVQEKTPGIYDIQVRGLNNIPDNNMLLYTENANTLLMIDGRPVQNCAMGALTFDVLPISIEDVERIEVIRGACGALYGANAVTGVINILTEKPGEGSKMASGNLQMGNNNTMIGDVALRHSWKDGKIAAGITANMQHRGRTTDKLPTAPTTANRYIVSDELAASTHYLLTTPAQVQAWVESGDLTLAQEAKLRSIDEIEHMRTVQNSGTNSIVYNTTEPETYVADQFESPGSSRKNIGVNGYLSITPAKGMRIDLSAGYQQSLAMATPVGDDVFTLACRKFKTEYVNIVAEIKGLQINAGYSGGSEDYTYGAPGFKVQGNNFNASAEYDIHIGDLSVKPGITYEYIKFLDYTPVFDDPTHSSSDINEAYRWHYASTKGKRLDDSNLRLSGFFDGQMHIYTIAPSIRLDYRIGDLRLTGAYRSDKTRIPDKWNHSWQFAANYKINDKNFVRFVFGRANRGCCLVNTSAAYRWTRTYMLPGRMIFQGNEDADLVHIDNMEIGYRMKPTENILLDAELFASKSKDYGGLMSTETAQVLQGDVLSGALSEYGTAALTAAMGGDLATYSQNVTNATYALYQNIESRSYIQYQNLPYEVNQIGLSLNMDWIISSKLIAKVNANAQRTWIDKYYKYSQSAQITSQLTAATASVMYGVLGRNLTTGETESDHLLANDCFQTIGAAVQNYMAQGYTQTEATEMTMQQLMGFSPVFDYMASSGYESMTKEEQETLLANLKAAGIQGKSYGNEGDADYTNKPLGMYYALKYQIQYNSATNEYFFGSQVSDKQETKDGHKHKATPSIYGMIGLIYKPTAKLSVSAFANFIGKRTYTTCYGDKELGNRCTLNLKLGYKPTSEVEVFFNAHNLLNTEKQEFAYADKIGGTYTIGVNFGF